MNETLKLAAVERYPFKMAITDHINRPRITNKNPLVRLSSLNLGRYKMNKKIMSAESSAFKGIWKIVPVGKTKEKSKT